MAVEEKGKERVVPEPPPIIEGFDEETYYVLAVGVDRDAARPKFEEVYGLKLHLETRLHRVWMLWIGPSGDQEGAWYECRNRRSDAVPYWKDAA